MIASQVKDASKVWVLLNLAYYSTSDLLQAFEHVTLLE